MKRYIPSGLLIEGTSWFQPSFFATEVSAAADRIFIVCGARCSGKTTLVNSLMTQDPGIGALPIYTTRRRRRNESSPAARILSTEQFSALLDSHHFFYARVRNGYSTGYAIDDYRASLERHYSTALVFRTTGALLFTEYVPHVRVVLVKCDIDSGVTGVPR